MGCRAVQGAPARRVALAEVGWRADDGLLRLRVDRNAALVQEVKHSLLALIDLLGLQAVQVTIGWRVDETKESLIAAW